MYTRKGNNDGHYLASTLNTYTYIANIYDSSIFTNHILNVERQENDKKLYIMDDYLYYILPRLIARKILETKFRFALAREHKNLFLQLLYQ